MPHLRTCAIALWASVSICAAQAQSDSAERAPVVSPKYIDQSITKLTDLQQALDKKTEKLLRSLQKQEGKMQRKLARTDSAKAAQIFGDAAQQYQRLSRKLSQAGDAKQYIPSLDSISTSFKFLQENPQLLAVAKDGPAKLNTALAKAKDLQTSFQKTEEIRKFLKERKAYLRERLEGLGMAKQLKNINKQAYYYGAQVNEYKAMLKDHQKAEKKALEALSKTKLFKDFMRSNSQLASLFRLPGDPNDPTAQASLAGLQTRAQVNSLVQQQIAAGGPNAQAQFSQNMQQAQTQMSQLKDKISKIGSGGSDMEMPEGFKPNGQKTKSFFQRIELGANIQSQKANGFFPVTSDIGLSAGYKLNDKSVIGIGASYKMGWGQNIRNIKITHQGIGLRSFADVKLKGSFWLTGGYEVNYRSGFQRIAELRDRSAWQESGLIGLSKVIDIRSKLLKKTKVQLLWDFLSYRQIPKPASILFRVGYSF